LNAIEGGFNGKRNIIGIIFAAVVVVFALLAWSHYGSPQLTDTNLTTQTVPIPEDYPEQMSGGVSHTMALEKNLPDNVEKIMVYKTVPSTYTRQDILSFAQKFNISPIGKIKEVAEGSSVASIDGKIQAILHNSGFAEYHNSNRDIANPLDNPDYLPSDDKAIKIATTFLKDRDLLPDGAEFRKIGHSESYHLGNDGNNTLIWKDVEVWYGRKLNGYPVEGTQLMLALGSNGDPIEYFTNWRNYQPYQELPVKTPAQAFGELKTNGISVGMNTPGKVSINNMYLAYHTTAGADTEEYLQPVWMFKGDVIVNGNPVMPVEQYIPALSVTPGATAIPTATLSPVIPTNIATIPTLPTTAIPNATVAVNQTATIPVPTDTIPVTQMVSLNATQNATFANSTSG
jgi:hypothetical protein